MTTITKQRFLRMQLPTNERPKAYYKYYVTGSGHFPVDMLRYDSAWPASSEDAVKMALNPVNREELKMRSIQLRSYSEPTIDRWSSFLWSVGTERLG